MEIQKNQTFEQFFQAETLNAEKKKTYYQRYDVKRLRAFHKQAMIKQQIYDDMPSRQSGMNYSPYVAPKNKTMAHSMILNNRISCVVGISIFGFKTYWKQVFDLMKIQTTQTFEQLLQAETLNSKKKKSCCQLYNVKRLRAFHNQAMIKQKYTITCLQDKVGWTIVKGYSLKQVSSAWKRQNNSP